MPYIETSLLVASYCKEKGSVKSQKYLQYQNQFVISWLTLVEFASAIAKRVRTKELPINHGVNIYNLFDSHIKQDLYDVVSVQKSDFESAQELISNLGHTLALRTLDALHIALAKREKLVMATADKKLAESSKRLGLKTDFIKY